ncbi:MAG: hypothetical protein K9J80_07945 [Sulfuritalea sp.]|nr:hypothetical protein [Sulfuritalea sp.]
MAADLAATGLATRLGVSTVSSAAPPRLAALPATGLGAAFTATVFAGVLACVLAGALAGAGLAAVLAAFAGALAVFAGALTTVVVLARIGFFTGAGFLGAGFFATGFAAALDLFCFAVSFGMTILG